MKPKHFARIVLFVLLSGMFLICCSCGTRKRVKTVDREKLREQVESVSEVEKVTEKRDTSVTTQIITNINISEDIDVSFEPEDPEQESEVKIKPNDQGGITVTSRNAKNVNVGQTKDQGKSKDSIVTTSGSTTKDLENSTFSTTSETEKESTKKNIDTESDKGTPWATLSVWALLGLALVYVYLDRRFGWLLFRKKN